HRRGPATEPQCRGLCAAPPSKKRCTFCCEHRTFTAGDISGAWVRRTPRRHGHHDPVAAFTAWESEGFLGGVWETAPWFWMTPPSAAARAEHKLLQLLHARR